MKAKDARIATSAMARALRDEDPAVRQLAVNFFTSPENEDALLNQMGEKEKRKLLPDFIRGIEDKGDNWGLRNNAAIALKYYPEQAQAVVPVLVKALKDLAPQVRLLAAKSLYRVAPDAAVPALIESLESTNALVAATAAQSLAIFKEQADAIIPALQKAAERKDDVSGWAKAALKQIKSEAAANQGINK